MKILIALLKAIVVFLTLFGGSALLLFLTEKHPKIALIILGLFILSGLTLGFYFEIGG